MKIIRYVFIITILVNCYQTPILAIVNEEIFSQFQFNLVPPGARSISMGGAFIGLADDATAVESNPAGLTALSRPEFSLEGQYIAYEINRPYWGLISGDSIITTKKYTYSGASKFINVVYPYHRFVFSLYYQVLTDYTISYETPYTSGVTHIPDSDGIWIEPFDVSFELSLTDYGFAAATEIFDGFSVAVSPRLSRMNIKAQNIRAKSLLFDPSFTSEIDGSDNGLSVNTGILWKFHPKFSFGATYKYGAAFTVKESCISHWEWPEYEYENDVTLKIPDSFGGGIAFQPTKFLTFTLSVIYTQYKDLLENFTIDPNYLRHLLHYMDGWDRSRQQEVAQAKLSKENFTIDNTTEIHLGMEYVIAIGKSLFILRAGMYYEPDHTLRFTGTTGDHGVDLHQKILFPSGKGQLHLTNGIGIVMDDHFQMDTTVNISEENTQLSLSIIYRF